MKNIFLILSIMLAVSLSAQSDDEGGQALPSAKIKDLKGKVVDIIKYADNDKLTIFSFWATWCAPCKDELNNISELYEEWVEEYDVEVVAISQDDSRNASKVTSYINGQGWEFDVLIDSNSDLKRVLNFQGVPYTLLIDKEGNIVYRHSGYVEGDEYILEDEIAKYSY